jgi:hypothetical protein
MDFSDIRSSIPSIHMPRWASRLLLTVENVGRERLQDVNHREAMQEGVAEWAKSQPSVAGWVERNDSRALFVALWDSLYGQSVHRWAENPRVVVLRFSVSNTPIDPANRS